MPDKPNNPIVFTDMADRDAGERQRLANSQFDLEVQKRDDKGRLPPELYDELKAITEKLDDRDALVDPLFAGPFFPPKPEYPGVAAVLGQISQTPAVGPHRAGLLPSQQGAAPAADLTAAEKTLAAVYGLLEADGLVDPKLERFVPGVARALGEYTANQALFEGVLKTLLGEGDTGARREVQAERWATVVRILRADGVSDNDPYLPLKTRLALGSAVGANEDAPPSSINIDLPDLEAQADIEIVADNLRAMQALYFAAMLEDLKFFQVADKLVESFQSGMLPLGKGPAGNNLYHHWKKSVERLSEIERRNLYARTFGFPGGEATQASPNREFSDLWLRFVSAISTFVRQFRIDDLLRSTVPLSVSQEQVRKAGRDLAANLSLHGYGIAYFAAIELQTVINEIIALLSDQEIKNAYGARDMWQVIDQVATLELGGAKNSIRYRTMATSGAIIIRWLAEHAQQLASASQVTVLNIDQIRNPAPRYNGSKPTVDPTDRDLVDACDQWLAVTGTQDKSVEEYAQPSEGPNMTSRPIQIPQIARDLLESVGVNTNGAGRS
jgi:hypothetical protein